MTGLGALQDAGGQLSADPYKHQLGTHADQS